jgi:RNA polymerase sigma-70 factor (ECF subfamily)
VRHAREGTGEIARVALDELCAATWYPLYAFARRRGLARDDAADATQGFFAEFLARGGFARADEQRGRMRAFLSGAFQKHLAKRAEAARAEKRGGGATPLSFDADAAESRFAREPAHALGPEQLFAAAWARTLLAQVVDALRAEYAARGQGELFAALEGELAGDTTPQAELAARLGSTEGAVKVAAHRLRTRYREQLRAAILATLDDLGEFEDELAGLLAAVSTAPPDTDP